MIQPIILAGGKGTRMKSDLPKALFPIMGKPMVRRVIDAFERTSISNVPILVVGYCADQVRAALGPAYTYVLQEILSGTATAATVGLSAYAGSDPVFITHGDQPLLQPKSIEAMAELFERERPALVLGTVTVEDYLDWRAAFVYFGRIVRNDDGSIGQIVEKEAEDPKTHILEVNAAVYCVDSAWLRTALPRIKPQKKNGEYPLGDIVALAKEDGLTVLGYALRPEEALGINAPEDVAPVERFLNAR